HETLVLRAVAAIPATASGVATVRWEDDGARGALEIESALAATEVLAPRDGWKYTGRHGAEWSFTSRYFASPVAELRDFPFFNETGTAQIVVPENPSDDAKWAAQRMQVYFQFWGKEGMEPA